MAFQGNAFQHNAFQTGIHDGAGAPPGGAPWYLWAAVSSAIALASCAAPEYRTQGPQTLQPFRQTPVLSSGMGVMLGTQVVLLADEGIRQPDKSSHRLFFGRGAGTPPPQRLELHQPSKLPAEPDTDYRRADHSLLHRYRVGYQTVGQPWIALQPHVSVQVEAEGYTQHPTDYTPLYGRTTPVPPPTAGAPWYLWQAAPVAPRIEPESVSIPATDYRVLFGRGAQVLPQHWWLYRWQGPAPDTSQFYEYRSRDFWSDLQPFRITPTTPVEPPAPGGGGAWWYWHSGEWPEDEKPDAEEIERVADEAVRELDRARERTEKARRKPLAAAIAQAIEPEIDVSGALNALRLAHEGLSRLELERAAALADAAMEMEAAALAADIARKRRNAALLLLLHEAI